MAFGDYFCFGYSTTKGNSCSGGSRISRRGGHRPRRGVWDSRGGYVLKILYVKMKESGPLGGAPLDPPMSCEV